MKPQFNYCPLVWMFCSKTSSHMINKLLEKSVRITLTDYSSGFNELLENNNDICNHHRNTQPLLIEISKLENELAPSTMESMLNRRFNAYNPRNFQEFVTETLSC